jgi:peptide/nickel transport system permease protein
MIHIVPGDPVERMLGEGAAPGEVTQLRHALNLDQPLLTQYGHYLKQLLRGDLGQSFKFQAPVRRIIFERYPATLQLAFLALIVCAAIAIPAWCACRVPSRTYCGPRRRRVCSFRMIGDSR